MLKYLKVCGIPLVIALLSITANAVSFWLFLFGDILSVAVLFYIAYRNNCSFVGTAICGILFMYAQYTVFVLLFMASERGLYRDIGAIIKDVVNFMPLVQVGLVGAGLIIALICAIVKEFSTGNKFRSSK